MISIKHILLPVIFVFYGQYDIIIACDFDIHVNDPLNTYVKEFVSNVFNLLEHICHCGHTHDHVFYPPTDDVVFT